VKNVTNYVKGCNERAPSSVIHVEEVKDVSEAAVEEREAKVLPCRHHWVIETPSGSLSLGRCRRCGAVREFRNSIPETYWDEESSLGAWGKKGASEEKALPQQADGEPALAL